MNGNRQAIDVDTDPLFTVMTDGRQHHRRQACGFVAEFIDEYGLAMKTTTEMLCDVASQSAVNRFCSQAGMTVTVNVASAVPCTRGLVVVFVSRTSTVKVEVVLRLVGVPEITPVAAFSLSPPGRLPDTVLQR